MHTITKDSGMAPAAAQSCLACKKLVNVAAGFAVEVAGTDDGLEGYLHRYCRKAWEEKHPGFRYTDL